MLWTPLRPGAGALRQTGTLLRHSTEPTRPKFEK